MSIWLSVYYFIDVLGHVVSAILGLYDTLCTYFRSYKLKFSNEADFEAFNALFIIA